MSREVQVFVLFHCLLVLLISNNGNSSLPCLYCYEEIKPLCSSCRVCRYLALITWTLSWKILNCLSDGSLVYVRECDENNEIFDLYEVHKCPRLIILLRLITSYIASSTLRKGKIIYHQTGTAKLPQLLLRTYCSCYCHTS